MVSSLGFVRFLPVIFCSRSIRIKRALAALLFVLPLIGPHAFAQTTTVSGTVYDPRTTASSLPLPNVLVYVTTGAVAALPSGVQCLTTSDPTGVVGFTYTAADGTFTIGNVPANAAYTVVIQAGKWRRQFSETVAAGPLTGLALHMPSDHTQGDIPMIAIATGNVDAFECVFRKMGIADTEFTDDNVSVNPAGHIHLYKGSGVPGAEINGSTPSETALMTSSTLMSGYDVIMFPCQGSPLNQATPAGASNLLSYANSGGRVFTTHYSYAWLEPAAPYNSRFPPVANWVPETQPLDGTATIDTSFTDGATLAQWLQNVGASATFGQVPLTTLRNDIGSIIPPTQSWAKLISNGDTMAMTFNTPVGASAANQCGRVLFNDYHVFNGSFNGDIYPAECATSTTMTPQEEMLEYALFDLSSFVTPVVVPTALHALQPQPDDRKAG